MTIKSVFQQYFVITFLYNNNDKTQIKKKLNVLFFKENPTDGSSFFWTDNYEII